MIPATQVIDRRIGAFLIDFVIILIGTLVALLGGSTFATTEVGGIDAAEAFCDAAPNDICLPGVDEVVTVDIGSWWPPAIALVALLILRGVLEGMTGATPGKALTRIRVVDHQGTTIGVARGLIRNAMVLVDGFPWGAPMLVGVTVAANSSLHQRLGDRLADSYVVHQNGVGRSVDTPVTLTTPLPPRPIIGAANPPPPTGPRLDAPGTHGPTHPGVGAPAAPLDPSRPAVMPTAPPTVDATPPAPAPPPPTAPPAPRPPGMSFDETLQSWIWVDENRELRWNEGSNSWEPLAWSTRPPSP